MDIKIKSQPDDETCGPTSLHAIYRYFDDRISLENVIQQVERVSTGGTIAALIGKHALKRGYNAHLYVYNVDIFDPCWFPEKIGDRKFLIERLARQAEVKKSKRLHESTQAYIDYLKLGGDIYFRDLTVNLLKHYFEQKIPVLTGLSATYLYQSPREKELRSGELVYDDIYGTPCGHFVVLSGYDETKRHIVVADPHRKNPISKDNHYRVGISRLINSIMLGVLTYDANLLVIQPKS